MRVGMYFAAALIGVIGLICSGAGALENNSAPVVTGSDFDRFYCEENDGYGKCVLYRASILNLITTPERFHSKRIRVIGYLSMSSDGDEVLLFFMKGASHHEAVWLSLGNGEVETEADVDQYRARVKQIWKQFNSKRIMVEGEFDMGMNVRAYRGGIKKVVRIEVSP